MSERPVLHVAAAFLRRGDDVVLVHQGAPGEPLHWSLPGGILEEGELVTEAVVREVREETSALVDGVGPLAFVVHVDSRRPLRLRGSTEGQDGYGLTVWTFEIDSWTGAIAAADPERVVHEAALVHRDDAAARLDDVWWQGSTVRYLRGELVPGSLVLERWWADGTIEVVETIAPAPPRAR